MAIFYSKLHPPGVREADHSDACLNDIVPQANDESVRPLLLELGAILVQHPTKLIQVSPANSYKSTTKTTTMQNINTK